MTPNRLLLCAACIAISLASGRPAHAQTFVELGGGWNYLAPAAAGDSYYRAFNIQASLGWSVSPDFGIRLDVFTNQFRAQVLVPSHLNNPFGSNLTTEYEAAGVTGLSADAIGNVDSRGIVYTFGGVGVYSKYQGSPAGFSAGASLGAGIAIPFREHLRVFAEARKHFLFGADPTPPWIVPITVGVRY